MGAAPLRTTCPVLVLLGLAWWGAQAPQIESPADATPCERALNRHARMPDPILCGQPLDINGADVAQLARLPGVGEVLAERIVANRSLHGAFSRLSDLQRVVGVGPARVEALRPWAIVATPAPVTDPR